MSEEIVKYKDSKHSYKQFIPFPDFFALLRSLLGRVLIIQTFIFLLAKVPISFYEKIVH